MLEEEDSVFGDDFKPAKTGQWAQFCIETGVEYSPDGKSWPQIYKYEGLARIGQEGEIATFGGWNPKLIPQPMGTVDWPEGDLYFPSNSRELFILNSVLIMN